MDRVLLPETDGYEQLDPPAEDFGSFVAEDLEQALVRKDDGASRVDDDHRLWRGLERAAHEVG